MTKNILKLELERVNHMIDQRIKAGKKYSYLEEARKKIINELGK